MAGTVAFVTLVSSDNYLPGALAQVAALNDLHPRPSQAPEVDFQTVCLVTPESLNVATVRRLRKAFDLVVGVEILEQDNSQGLKLLGRPDLTTVLTKLHIFRLTQFKKIIFLDADVLPVRPISHLFNIPHEFAAAPDVGWPDIFNSGVLVLNPGEDKFTELYQLIKSKPSWDGGDQGILNEWRGDDWHRLSFTYNTTPTAAYTYAPAYERFGSQISAIHFIGSNKPWNSLPYRAPFAGRQPDPPESAQRAYDYQSLVDRWYDVYDRHYRAETSQSQGSFEVKPYPAVWDHHLAESPHPPPPANTFDLDNLKCLALQGLNASATQSQPGEGLYTSMPLEGRIDLMRPRKPVTKQDMFEKSEDDKHQDQAYVPDDSDRFTGATYDENLSTPIGRPGVLSDGDPPRWHTLPTPGPNEVPSSPRLRLVSLPPTPTSVPHLSKTTPDFYASESESDRLLLARTGNDHHYDHHHREHAHPQHPSHSHQQPEHQYQHRYHPQAYESREDKRQGQGQPHKSHSLNQSRQHSPEQYHDHGHQHSYQQQQPPPPRPISPPMVAWNPAIEPPPNVAPTPNAFPSDTYFANVWDQTPSRQHDQAHAGLGPSPSHSDSFFHPLPPAVIPETLLKQGHYRNVTGDSMEATPSPDRSKVKSVFPWEQKPRVLPGRVFPDSDAPPPSLFLSPGSQSQTSTTTPSTPETRGPTLPTRPAPLSPLYGLPTTLNYSNAWDNVPSIQKYASRLAKPPLPPPALAPAFEDDSYRRSRRRSRDERAEISSRDGDDEDNADDEDEDDLVAAGTKWDDDSDRESAKRRSRSGSVVKASLKPKKKEYRSRGVQTMTVEMRSQAVQVDPPKSERHVKRASVSGKRQWAPTTAPTLLAPAMTRDVSIGGHDLPAANITPLFMERKKSPSVSPTTRSPALSPSMAPREFVVSPVAVTRPATYASPQPSKPTVRTATPSTAAIRASPPVPQQEPAGTAAPRSRSSSTKSSPAMARQASLDSSITSPVSSKGPVLPADGYLVMSPQGSMRKGGRVWDPARGVELFKRGSEEVLARFLKMGSFEQEAR
ncbi:unnamed protein product [Cyclocybe aegerita]|uniref:glycogenin glucosyltransferase n=1 Tax=Cyclocybe aegerita TaxID=1973307 RepID=A0A8S0VX95_CYCAE|nr:unnamed protein product [Cyclocybe aegerita]